MGRADAVGRHHPFQNPSYVRILSNMFKGAVIYIKSMSVLEAVICGAVELCGIILTGHSNSTANYSLQNDH